MAFPPVRGRGRGKKCKIMLAIFAELGTTNKAAISCNSKDIQSNITLLQKKFGGTWLFVEKVHPDIQCITFTDNQVYNGFTPNQNKYCKSVTDL